MLDLKLIRDDPGAVKKAMKHRGIAVDIDAILEADALHRAAIAELEEARAAQNAKSKGPASPEAIEELKAAKGRIKELEAAEDARRTMVESLVVPLPNIPLADTPVGADASDNVVVREWGTKPAFSFTPKHYLDIAAALGIIDTEQAAVVSGTRFGYLLGGAALLEFALIQYAVSKLTAEPFSYRPVVPPVLIRPEMMRAMGFAERAGAEAGTDEMYYLPKDDLYLIGTSEQSIGAYHYDRIIPSARLPLRYLGFSTCFRRESGAAGKDTRGILRVHQFDKLEMFSVCAPEQSGDEHLSILAAEEALMQGLGLHYRVVRLCTGDLGQASAATYDIETWMPGQEEYRETHSTSNTTDYQARALKTRSRAGEDKPELVHMLNGTAFAVGRMVIAILEQYQNEDGTVRVPDVLRPFMGGRDTIS